MITEGSTPAAMPGGSASKGGARIFTESVPTNIAFKVKKIAHNEHKEKLAHCN